MEINTDTVVVVTGAASGMGAALARVLADVDCRLVLADVDRPGLDRTSRALPTTAEVLTAVVDVSRRSELDTLAETAVARFGHVDIMINNAGVALDAARIDQLDVDRMAAVMDVNFWGVVHGTQAFLPHLARRPRAAVVNVSSSFGLTAVGWQSPYCASKFAVRGFTDSLRMELAHVAPHVRAVLVHPGGVRTGIVAASRRSGTRSEAQRDREMALFEAGLRTGPEQAARAIVRGVRRDRSRVLIGRDARVADVLARALPTGYSRVVLRQMLSAGLFDSEPPLAGATPTPPATPTEGHRS